MLFAILGETVYSIGLMFRRISEQSPTIIDRPTGKLNCDCISRRVDWSIILQSKTGQFYVVILLIGNSSNTKGLCDEYVYLVIILAPEQVFGILTCTW